MHDERKQLIEDAAKLLGILWFDWHEDGGLIIVGSPTPSGFAVFNPLDPERGDLMKVADTAGLVLDFEDGFVVFGREIELPPISFTKGDHQSQAYAVLRAASTVLKARGGE